MGLLLNPWFQVGMGLLANSGPSPTPVNPWKGIGQGLMAVNEARVAEQEARYNDLRLQHEQSLLDAQQRQTDLVNQMAGNEPDPQQAALIRAFPETYAKEALTPHPSVQVNTAGELGIQGLPPDQAVQVKYDGRGNLVDVNPLSPAQGYHDPATIQEYKLANSQGYKGTFMDYQRDIARAGMNQQGYSVPISTPNGLYWGDTRNKTVTPMLGPDNQPLMRAQDSPNLQGQIAGEKAEQGAIGKASGEAAAELPGAQMGADRVHSLVEELRSHPGLDAAVGGMRGIVPGIPGTEQGDFVNRLDQVMNNAFMEARTALKGGGQITDFEGKKAESAIGRMRRSTTKKEFMDALADFDDAVNTGMKKLHAKAGASKSFKNLSDDDLRKHLYGE